MSFWQTMDVAGFRCINSTLRHPVLDALMPFFSWNEYFLPTVLALIIAVVWKAGARGRCLVLVALLIIPLGDMLVVNTLKQVIARPRPFQALADVHLLVGMGSSASMPSSHASSWFAAVLLGFVYYRWSLLVLVPVAMTIGFSRTYVGVHYPSDVLAGAILGMGYAAAGLYALEALWRQLGRAWFPNWWSRMPSLINPVVRPIPLSPASNGAAPNSQLPTLNSQLLPAPPARNGSAQLSTLYSQLSTQTEWLRLGWLVIAAVLVGRLVYLASGAIELSEDEAYQWVWSKHLALSYYSKPPLIAYTQFLGTHLWGDTEFGVRFFSPVLGAALSLLLLRFLAREINARAAFWLLMMAITTPLLAVGSTLLTVDPLLVLFWNAALVAGWRAVQPEGTTRQWALVGVCTGLGLLSKYTALAQLACWAVFFACHAPARRHLRRPGPYVALGIIGLCSVPMIVWNAQHHWITVQHVAMDNAGLSQTWHPTLRYLQDFLGTEAVLLNPVFFAAILWAVTAFWRRKTPLMLYCFSMGAPLFLGYLLFTLHSRVMPNWIAAAVLPLFCLAVMHWERRWRDGARAVKPWLALGVALGGAAVVLLHNTDLVQKIAGRPLPPMKDPLRRVRAWSDTAEAVNAARRQLQTEGREVFLIGDHYGMVGQLSFYVPEAKAAVSKVPLAYFRTTSHPENQFYFWPGYRGQRRGQNAIFVLETDAPQPPPPVLAQEFDSVTDLGLRDIKYEDRVLRRLQLFACRNLH